VHLEAGNLSLDRVDLSLDTRLGLLEHGVVYNSASGRWSWRHEMTYVGGIFTDVSGAEHDVSALVDGAAIPGTYWVKIDDTQVRTKGGRVHLFDATTGRLRSTRWADGPFPVLRYEVENVAGVLRTTRIDQCVDDTSCSEQFVFHHDAAGCLDEVIDRAGRVARYEYGAECRMETARSALDVERGWLGTRYEYGGAGRLRALTNSEGERVEFEYRGGRIAVVRRVGEAGPEHRMVYVFDEETGRSLTHVVTPAGSIWRYEFDERGRLLRRVSPEGVVLEQGWSGLRPAWQRDANGSTWQFEYRNDDLNRVTDPGGHVTLVFHAATAVDRVHPRQRPISRIHDSLGVREVRSYDSAGRLAALVDGLDDVIRFSWDELGQLASMTLPDDRVVSYHDYGEHGHPARIERGELVERRLFDAVGNLEKSDSLLGELATGRPGMIRRRFDAGRNVAEVWTPEGQPGSTAYAIAKTYLHSRSDGRPTHVERPHGGDLEFVHDELGRLVARRERVDGTWQTTSIEFGIENRPTRVIRPNGMTAAFSWDLDERTTRVVRTHAGAATEDVKISWAAGRVVRIDDVAHPLPELRTCRYG